MTRSAKYLQGFVIIVVASLFFQSLQMIFQHFRDNVATKINNNHNDSNDNNNNTNNAETSLVNWRNLTKAQMGSMSELGKWLLSQEDIAVSKSGNDSSKEYLILIWKYGMTLERRHLRHFTSEKFSPWENCSVNNCRLSYDSADAEEADAILFHLQRIRSVKELPKNLQFEKRTKQRWVFLTDETPYHTFLNGNQRLSSYNGLFNWSMTYRMDSDVPVPYGRTVLIKNAKKSSTRSTTDNLTTKKTKLVAIMGSNCKVVNRRWEYVSKLKEILGKALDIYGHCLGGDTQTCPGRFDTDCPALGAYKFYLAFENSNCAEYATEKIFWNSYHKYSIPIIMGATRENCKQLLPPKSFIHVEDFANPYTLADYILYLDKNNDEYLKFHEWRNSFKVLNEHGYFKSASRHYCRLCEALNYNQRSPKVYDDLDKFWSVKRDCR